ncbi:MAG: Chemotaxis response regulator protein-glutamate methylesterase of group 1 operon [Verrucomicrobiota bacterium]
MRRRLTEAFAAAGDLAVVAAVADGEEALARAAGLTPDVLALEISLPRVDGLVVIERLMRHQPRPIVAMGEHARPDATAGRAALAAGAVELAARPAGVLLDSAEFCAEVIAKVRRAARVRVVRTAGIAVAAPAVASASAPVANWTPPPAWSGSAEAFPIVVIASSTGGPAALTQLARRWGARPLPALLVAQHLPAGFTAELARQLQSLCPAVEIREAREGDAPRPGLVLIAPGGFNLELAPRGVARLTRAGLDTPWVPSADRLFATAAEAFGTRVRAFVLTGMGDDGAAGVRAVVRAGGLAWAQDADSCVVDGMPAAARATGSAPARTLDEIAALVLEHSPLLVSGEAVA